MSDAPSISVVIPVFQAVEYIDACLQSLVAQEYSGKVECILVDDCGKDDSMARVRRFIAAYEGPIDFRLAANPCNKGAAAARNTGMALAQGDYLFFLDSDDTLPADALRTLAAPLARRPFDMVVGQYHETEECHGKGQDLPDGTVLEGREILHQYLQKHLSVIVCNKLYRRAFLQEHGLVFVEGIIYEDDLWSFKAALHAQSLYFLDRETYIYTIHPGSVMTSTQLQKRIHSYRTVMEEMYRYGVAHGLRWDKAFHNRMEQYRLNILRMLSADKSLFRETYGVIRQAVPKPWSEAFRLDGLKVNKQIRDFHLALPAGAGAAYMYAWFKAETLVKK